MAQTAGYLVGNGPGQLSQFLGAHGFSFLPADQNNFLADFRVPDISYVHHHLVHTNPADNPCPFTANQAKGFIGKTAGIAVAIAKRQSGKARLAGSDIGMAVANAFALLHILDIGNPGL